MARVTLKQVTHTYTNTPADASDYALKRIDMTWNDGGAYALLGPSGCGKTTLLNIISGLVKPSHGRILFNDRDVTDLPPEKRNIAQVFQFPVLYDTMTVYANLAFPLKNQRLSKKEIHRRVLEVAEILELEPVLAYRAAGLPADVKQKISLGRGLVRNDVAAILFDEPFTVIDPHLKWRLRCTLKSVHHASGLTFIYVTHDQVEALTFADHIMVMYAGKIVQIGTPQELFEHPAHKFVGYFIGSPGMNFVPCTVQNQAACFGNIAVPLDPDLAAKVTGTPRKLSLGIRPLYLQVTKTPQKNSFEARVVHVEDHGNYKIVSLNLAGHVLKAQLPEDEPVPASIAHVHFPRAWIRLFADDQLVH